MYLFKNVLTYVVKDCHGWILHPIKKGILHPCERHN